MTFYELYNELSRFYSEELRCEWDNDGIMCSDCLNREVKHVLVSLDVTKTVIEYAVANGFDTIVSHHPLIFRSQESLTPLSFTQNKLISLVQNGVGVMSFHTRLDAAEGGVNDVLASLLNLKSISIDKADPIGRIGFLESAKSLDEFASDVKASLSSPFVLFSGCNPVKKVYVVGGDGKDFIDNAIMNGCDTLVTGRASYNSAVDACDMGVNIIEAGHFYTENPVCKALAEKIKSIDSNIQLEIYNSNKIKVV